MNIRPEEISSILKNQIENYENCHNRTFAVNRLTGCIYYTSQQGFPYRNFYDTARFLSRKLRSVRNWPVHLGKR